MSSPVFVSLGANIGTPVNMLVDAVLHGDWPSIPQYCGTVLIAVSFIILVAWHGTKSYNSVLPIKAAYYHLHLMLCLLFTIKGRSWETKMAQKQEDLCCMYGCIQRAKCYDVRLQVVVCVEKFFVEIESI